MLAAGDFHRPEQHSLDADRLCRSAGCCETAVSRPIYLDYRHDSPVDPRARCDASAFHRALRQCRQQTTRVCGWEAQKAVDAAREQVARLIGANSNEICFTSGATESNNLAIKGTAQSLRERGMHLISVVTEHKSVLDSFKRLRGRLARHLARRRSRRLHRSRRTARRDHS